MDLGLFAGEKVGIALELESRPAADDNRNLKQGLERYDRLLPAQRAAGTAEDATGRLLQPSRGHVLCAQGTRVAMSRQPSGIDEKPFREVLLEPV